LCILAFLTSALNGSEWSASHYGHFISRTNSLDGPQSQSEHGTKEKNPSPARNQFWSSRPQTVTVLTELYRFIHGIKGRPQALCTHLSTTSKNYEPGWKVKKDWKHIIFCKYILFSQKFHVKKNNYLCKSSIIYQHSMKQNPAAFDFSVKTEVHALNITHHVFGARCLQ
jgi:hypothetical protein